MPDWRQFLRKQMEFLSVRQDEEMIEELSTHLEEIHNDLLDRGYAPQVAFERTLQEVDDWNVLFKRISRARPRRNPMNDRVMNHMIDDRVRRLWFSIAVTWLGASSLVLALQRRDGLYPLLILFYLPWLAALPLLCAATSYLAQRGDPAKDRSKRLWLSVTVTWLGAALSLVVSDRARHPELVLRRPLPVMLNVPWVATLILVGAASAYLAQRADAPRKTRLLVATSPALLLGVVMLLILLPWYAAVERYPWGLTFFAIDAENGAVVPGLALLLGALPFLLRRSASSHSSPNSGANASLCPTALPE